MKKLILAVLLALSFAVPAMALDFNGVSPQIKDNLSAVYKSGNDNAIKAAGLFFGPIGRVSQSGMEIMGVGGFNAVLNDINDPMLGITPVTFFGDTIQISIMLDPHDFRVNNPDSYMIGIGVSATELVHAIWK